LEVTYICRECVRVSVLYCGGKESHSVGQVLAESARMAVSEYAGVYIHRMKA